MNILVTGGSGYIGNFLISSLLKNGHTVTSIDQKTPSNDLMKNNSSSQLNFIEGNAVYPKNLPVDISEFDVVLPLAAIVGRKQCEVNTEGALAINYKAVENLVESLLPHQILIFPQTNMGFVQNISVQPSVFNDNSELIPMSCYTETKILGELAALKHAKTISLRLSSVFGVSRPMKDHLLLNFMVKEAVQKNVIELFEPNFFRSFVSLSDLSRLVESIISNDSSKLFGQKVNVSDPKLNITKIELATRIKSITGCSIEISSGNDPDMRNYIIESNLLSEFSFKYDCDLDTEINLLGEFYKTKSHH